MVFAPDASYVRSMGSGTATLSCACRLRKHVARLETSARARGGMQSDRFAIPAPPHSRLGSAYRVAVETGGIRSQLQRNGLQRLHFMDIQLRSRHPYVI